MAKLRLAGNFITPSPFFPGDSSWGHFALVLVDGATQTEIEVQAPAGITIPFGGDFVYPIERDHLLNTPNIDEPGGYAFADITLNPGQSAEQAWSILQQIHAQFSTIYTDIDYNIDQNSNSYAKTLLSIIGLEIENYIAEATPGLVADGFPGVERNLLIDQEGSGEQIELTLFGSDGNDILRLGNGNDVLSGGAGFDELYGGSGNDTIDTGEGSDFAYGGAGDDTITGGYGGNDTLFGHCDNDEIDIIDGAVVVEGEGEGSVAFGGSGNDTIDARNSNGEHFLSGGSGNDILYGNGFSTLDGGSGEDTFYVKSGDTIVAGEAADTIIFDDLTIIGNDFATRLTFTGNLSTVFINGHWYHSYTELGVNGEKDFAFIFTEISTETDPEDDRTLSGLSFEVIVLVRPDTTIPFSSIDWDTADYFVIQEYNFGDFGIGTIPPAIEQQTYYRGPESSTYASPFPMLRNPWPGLPADSADLPYGSNTTLSDRQLAEEEAFEELTEGNCEGEEHASNHQGSELDDIIQINGASGNVQAGAGFDTVVGSDGADFIIGEGGSDTISGGAGNDFLIGGTFENPIYAGSNPDEDPPYFGDGEDEISGGAGDDYIDGGTGDDTLYGDDGADEIYGGAGGDDIFGGAGDDYLLGGDGTDRIRGNEGDDYIDLGGSIGGSSYAWGNEGNDTIFGGQYTDRIFGNEGNDYIKAGAGDDYLTGGTGDDFLDGGSGENTYYYSFGDGSDHIRGASFSGSKIIFADVRSDQAEVRFINGDAYIYLSDGEIITLEVFQNDNLPVQELHFSDGVVRDIRTPTYEIHGTDGDDQLDPTTYSLRYKDTVIFGFGGNDVLSGFGNDDHILHGGDGRDTLTGRDGDDVLYGDSGDDILNGGRGDDDHFGGAGNDLLVGNVGADTFDGGEGIDTIDMSYYGASLTIDLVSGLAIFGPGSEETVINIENIIATSKNDTLIGDEFSNSILGARGNDVITTGDGYDTVVVRDGDGADVVTDFDTANDIIVINGAVLNPNAVPSGVSITQTGANVVITYGAGSTLTLSGIDLATWQADVPITDGVVTGSNANDTFDYATTADIDGDRINDFGQTIQGLDGDDMIIAGAGNDTIFGGSQHDIIYAGAGDDVVSGDNGRDTVYLEDGNDTFNDNNQTGFNGQDTVYGGRGDDTINGGGGADSLSGGSGSDIISGGIDNDLLSGGSGDDVFRFVDGDGDDTISDFDSTSDQITINGVVFNPFAPDAGSTAVQNGTDVVISYGSGDTITLFAVDLATWIDRLRPTDGVVTGTEKQDTITAATVVDADGDVVSDVGQTILGLGGNDRIVGGAGDDTIDGGDGGDSLDGGGGDDQIFGGGRNDIIWGGEGDDDLRGGDGDDYLIGGFGVDTLDGGAGIDTVDIGHTNTGFDVDLEAGTVTYSSGTIEQISNFENVVANDASNIVNGSAVSNIIEAEGGNDDLYGLGGDDVLDGGDGDDNHYGGAGNDVILGSFGDDFFDGGTGIDTIDMSYATEGMLIDLRQELVRFVSGFEETALNFENSIGSAFSDTLIGSDDGNVLNGERGDDTLTGGAGLDVFQFVDGYGNDIITDFNFSEDTIEINGTTFDPTALAAGVTVAQSGADTVISYGNGDTITLEGVDLAAWVASLGPTGDGIVTGTNGADIIDASTTVDPDGDTVNDSGQTINGLNGNDTITAGAGDDIIDGGANEDLIYAGDGNDTVYGGTYWDTIHGGNGNDTVFGDNGSDTVYLEAGDDIFNDNTQTGNNGRDTVFGGTGNDTINGGGGEDTFDGGSGADIIVGGADTDTLTGGTEADTFRFEDGDGTDVVTDFAFAEDTIEINGAAFDPTAPGAGVTVAQSGADTVVSYGSGDTITLQGVDLGAWTSFLNPTDGIVTGTNGADVINASTIVDPDGDTINDSGQTINGLNGDDTITAGAGNDTINGGSQYDTIYAGAGDDIVAGDNGRDTVYLGEGNDTFNDNTQTGTHALDTVFGGAGEDIINGGGGDDTFYGDSGEDLIYGGDGNDIIYGGTQWDTIHGGAGDDQVWGDNGRDTVYLNGGNDVFNDNTQIGTNGHDTVYGGDGNDTINGGGGNDIFFGDAGDDIITGGINNDTLTGGTGADTFVFATGDDVDVITDFEIGIDQIQIDGIQLDPDAPEAGITLAQAGADVTVSYGSGDTITLQDVDLSAWQTPTAEPIIGQAGSLTVTQSNSDQWFTVTFDQAITDAVVVLGPVEFNGSDPTTTRVRNVSENGFEFQIDEWDYRDGGHIAETISWMAVSAGEHTLANGTTIVAGSTEVNTSFETVSFGTNLTDAIVLSEVTTTNEASAVTTRLQNIDGNSFDIRLQEEEAGGAHIDETVSWIAIETGSFDGFEAIKTPNQVDEVPDNFVFNSTLTGNPVLLADIQTFNGADTSTLRFDDLTSTAVEIRLQEEASSDTELGHTNEVAGILVMDEGFIM